MLLQEVDVLLGSLSKPKRVASRLEWKQERPFHDQAERREGGESAQDSLPDISSIAPQWSQSGDGTALLETKPQSPLSRTAPTHFDASPPKAHSPLPRHHDLWPSEERAHGTRRLVGFVGHRLLYREPKGSTPEPVRRWSVER